MEEAQYPREGEIIPLLIRFRQPIRPPKINYIYSESLGLNVIQSYGKDTPIVLTNNALAAIKSICQTGGED